MKTALDTSYYLSFFKKELTDNLLFFWMDRCLDKENGGYLNCFSGDGSRLVSTDKYTWSMGRFLWIFSRLSITESDLFDSKERERFLRYAKSGRDFLLSHVLVGKNDFRCVYLMSADGKPKKMDGHEGYDLSIFADCFVVMGFAAYARAAKDAEAWLFAKNLFESVWSRYQSGNYRSLPYPVSSVYREHAKPMILTNVCCELYRAAQCFDAEYTQALRERIAQCHEEVFELFCDENDLIHEFCYAKGGFPNHLFGQHINPGHTLEDMWFQCEAADILKSDRYLKQIERTSLQTIRIGWDDTFGGIYHFIATDGTDTRYTLGDAENEPQMRLVLDDWGSKLWWVHSEALYTMLLLYFRTENEKFLDMFVKVFDYTYKTFPNPDRNIREWIQIRTREGKPQEKVVALPVKDPYHIIRNVLLIIELLEKQKRNKK